MIRQNLLPTITILIVIVGMARSGGLAIADELSDYRVLCDVWRKTDPEAGKGKQVVTPEERALLLKEVDGQRKGRAPHDFRRMAAITLGNLNAAEAVDKLIGRLADMSEDDMVSAEAALALGKIGDRKAMTALLDSLLDDRVSVRDHAASGLRLLAPTADEIAVAAMPQRFLALLAKAESIPLPKSEREWLDSYSTSSNKAFWTAREIDALCAGLNMGRPTKLSDENIDRTRKLAAKFLTAGFPAIAFQSTTLLPSLRRFCRELQPDLFIKKVEYPQAVPQPQLQPTK